MSANIKASLSIVPVVFIFALLVVSLASAGSLKRDVKSYVLSQNGINADINRLPAVISHVRK